MNPYKILNLDKNCSRQEIKSAYKKLALKFHPDKTLENRKEAEEKFKMISEAYQTLIDDDKRKMYDLTGSVDDNFFINPNELFETIFSEFDPEIKNFVMNTYKNFNNALDKTDEKSFLKVISNLDTDSLIKDSTKLLTNYFLAKTTETQTLKKQDLSNGKINLILNEKLLTKNNNIQLSIKQYFKKENYNIQIISENNDSSNYVLSTEFKQHHISFKNKVYNISFIDKVEDNLIRTNGYDLVTNLPIGLDDYRHGFLFILNFSNIQKSIKLSKSMILKFPKKGFPIWSKQDRGDLYVNFYLDFSKNRYYPEMLSTFFQKENSLNNILDNLNIYD